MNKLFLIVFLHLSIDLLAQNPFKQFWELSRPEKFWAVSHPFALKKVAASTSEARYWTKILSDSVLKYEGNGDQLDAFRHAYWMALLSSRIGARRACSLGYAHERGNYIQFKKGKLEDGVLPDSMSCQMDLLNNEKGICIALKLKSHSAIEIRDSVLQHIFSGDLYMLKKNLNGDFLDCSGNIIPKSNVKTWNISKCMIRTKAEL